MNGPRLIVPLLVALALAVGLLGPAPAEASRIRELTDVSGLRENQLVGYGLVVGLANTGDTGASRFTLQSVAAMLRRLGATIDPSMIQTRNAAAVMVTATLPADGATGTRIDVTVSSMGNARSLLGGTLLQTPLLGADGQVYVAAQGPVMIGGFGASGASGSSTQVNHLTAGRVPSGGIIERHPPGGGLPSDGPILLTLRRPSFVTARRIATAIDGALGDGAAVALDAANISITVPERFADDRVGLLAEVQLLDVDPEPSARVVIDERTGTVVVGSAVRLREAAVAHDPDPGGHGGLAARHARERRHRRGARDRRADRRGRRHAASPASDREPRGRGHRDERPRRLAARPHHDLPGAPHRRCARRRDRGAVR
jgi:flagellar P-ring protein precursor FlgI